MGIAGIRRLTTFLALLSLALGAPGARAAPADAKTVTLPGIAYQVLVAGPATGPHPTRADTITMRYVGRLESGEVFSTSPADGSGLSTFGVKEVIPGMSAALQLMRPGDRWRITMPPYLAYGPGRPLETPASAAQNSQVTQRRGIPPEAILVFDVELVAIAAAKVP
ncbi:FKBP-type peptidyl-prolyl cis-trans isomerase [Phenylobacterium sp.]|uniref:FKBP-type peptidyl-prolyl cis-trans isomerase n=1 Tax=Phenylobacterium sp. TaxID=1871053 RepID=UPI002F419378